MTVNTKKGTFVQFILDFEDRSKSTLTNSKIFGFRVKVMKNQGPKISIVTTNDTTTSFVFHGLSFKLGPPVQRRVVAAIFTGSLNSAVLSEIETFSCQIPLAFVTMIHFGFSLCPCNGELSGVVYPPRGTG